MKKDNKKNKMRNMARGAVVAGMTAFAIAGGSAFYHATTNYAGTTVMACDNSYGQYDCYYYYDCDYSSGQWNNYYMLPYSDSEYLSSKDLRYMSSYDLKIARNEIYARHGRRFKNRELQAYFDCQEWYHGTIAPENFNDNVLNKYEEANVALIKSFE